MTLLAGPLLAGTIASAEMLLPVEREVHGELDFRDVGSVRYLLRYSELIGDRVYVAATIFRADGPPEGRSLYEGFMDIPPARVEATTRGICFSAQSCAPHGENCSWFHTAFAYAPETKDFVEQQDDAAVCYGATVTSSE